MSKTEPNQEPSAIAPSHMSRGFAILDGLKKRVGIEREQHSDDWAIYRLAELREQGETATVRLIYSDQLGYRHYRFEIRRANGAIEKAPWPTPFSGGVAIEEEEEKPMSDPKLYSSGVHYEKEPPRQRRICNWCANTLGGEWAWTNAVLRIEGLEDGSISWLPERTLFFCSMVACLEQVNRTKDFLLSLPEAPGKLKLSLSVSVLHGQSEDVVFVRSRTVDYLDAADVRALARFFNGTSHPRLRPLLDAFEEEAQ